MYVKPVYVVPGTGTGKIDLNHCRRSEPFFSWKNHIFGNNKKFRGVKNKLKNGTEGLQLSKAGLEEKAFLYLRTIANGVYLFFFFSFFSYILPLLLKMYCMFMGTEVLD